MPIDWRLPLTGDRPHEFNAVSSMGDMMKLKAGVDAVHDYDEARADQQAVKRIVQGGQGNVGVIAKTLREQGYHKDADEFEARDAKQKAQHIKELGDGIDAEEKMLGHAGQMIRGVLMAPKETQADLWGISKARMAQMGPQMAQMAETVFGAAYDPDTTPTKLQYYENLGLTAQESNRRQRQALTDFQEGKPQKALGGMLSSVPAGTPPEVGQKLWDGMFAKAKELGIDEAILAMFPHDFTPDNVKIAESAGMDANTRADNATAAEKARIDKLDAESRGKTADAAVTRANAYARNGGPAGGGAGSTAADRRAAEAKKTKADEWLSEELYKIGVKFDNKEITYEQKQDAKNRAYTAYQSRLGGAPAPAQGGGQEDSQASAGARPVLGGQTVGDMMNAQITEQMTNVPYDAAPRGAQQTPQAPASGSDVAQTGAVSGGSPSSPSVSQTPPQSGQRPQGEAKALPTDKFPPIKLSDRAAVVARVKELLASMRGPNGKPLKSDDASVELFLKDPNNLRLANITAK